jgi:hypothetical protein
MQQFRAEMREDVREMVASARELTDWTWYVRTYPWLCLGAAAAAGYMLIPSRPQAYAKPDFSDLAELARQQKIVVKMEEPKSSPGLLGTLVRLAAGPLLQGGLAIAKHQLDQHLRQAAPPPRSYSSDGNGRAQHHD